MCVFDINGAARLTLCWYMSRAITWESVKSFVLYEYRYNVNVDVLRPESIDNSNLTCHFPNSEMALAFLLLEYYIVHMVHTKTCAVQEPL